MKYIPGDKPNLPTLELTRRNLQALLDKLDDPLSMHTLIDADRKIKVKAVEDDAHYMNRVPGEIYMPSTGEWR